MRLFYHRHEIFFSRVVPRDEREIGTLRIANGVSGEARVGKEPALVEARVGVGRASKVVVSGFHVERVLDVGLAARFVVEFRLDADALATLFGKNVHLVRRAATGERNSRVRTPPMST